jgi:hypothetical protein
MAQKQQGSATATRTKLGSIRAGGITVLRSPSVAHMKELINYGQTSNRRFHIKRK